jgi:hypothetical protein
LQLNESGLKIFAIDDLQNAAEKSVQFSKVVKMGKLSSFSHLLIHLLTSPQLAISMLVLNSLLEFEQGLGLFGRVSGLWKSLKEG